MELQPIMEGAEPYTRSTVFTLCTGESVRCDPTSLADLDSAEAAIREAARQMGPVDGRVMFAAARRQLGDIQATRAHLIAKLFATALQAESDWEAALIETYGAAAYPTCRYDSRGRQGERLANLAATKDETYRRFAAAAFPHCREG